MRTILTAARLVSSEAEVTEPILTLDDGHVVSVTSRRDTPMPSGEHHDYPESTLTAAFFDIHIHGSCNRDVMEATPDALSTVGTFLARHGVGAYLPTTITAPKETTLRALSGLATCIAKRETLSGARPRGIHIEGPFLSHAKKGAHPAHDLLPPSVEFFDRMWEASEGNIRLMTIAPELPNALDVIARAKALNVRISLGHSNATYSESQAAIAAGADSATHTFNAMRSFEQREPGLLAAVLGTEALYAELICDGLHVHPAAVRLFWKLKGPERAILITDAMSATGMADGIYKLGELDVRLVEGRALIGENTLAGSTVTLDAAVRNFASFTGAPVETVARLAGSNPSRMLGLSGELGELRVGAPANIVALSADGAVDATWIAGRKQYERKS